MGNSLFVQSQSNRDVELFDQWNDPKYQKANTAANTYYMTAKEKKVIYYLNLVRMNPALFEATYLKKDVGESSSSYVASLKKHLKSMKPVCVLYPDKLLWESARCFAIEAGAYGFTGHDRQSCTNTTFNGECCSYGKEDALDIIIQLLIDEGVPSLGHRFICLSNDYDQIGVAIQPHKTYRVNAVLDFATSPSRKEKKEKLVNDALKEFERSFLLKNEFKDIDTYRKAYFEEWARLIRKYDYSTFSCQKPAKRVLNRYHIICRSSNNRSDAQAVVNALEAWGFNKAHVVYDNGRYRASAGYLSSKEIALQKLPKLRETYPDAWIWLE